MTEPERPLPRLPEPDTEALWVASRDHELVYFSCSGCGQITRYGRSVCTACQGESMDPQRSRGEGVVYCCTRIHRATHPFFAARAPYCLALIDLDEGVRLMSELVDVAEWSVHDLVGQRVTVQWEDHLDLSVALFRLTG